MRRIALLRGINVGGRNRMPMADLRTICEQLGWQEVQTYIQSGNVVFRSAELPAADEALLERAIAQRFQLHIPVIVRNAATWAAYAANNPFMAESHEVPSHVMLALAKEPLRSATAEELQEQARDGERLVAVGEALWIYYSAGAGRSRLSPALLDRYAGSPVTTRNWRTVLQIGRLITGEQETS
ncbi:MAG TPA: DUF1697 domain-containing protein [Roseiflexaceae bacterium]|nr:DUF1697 domain-containing protein [Roseiflexaceae bacterium]HMP43181.1 DUF1697 domain-containing protein [Roseiflexaceae bacterium]